MHVMVVDRSQKKGIVTHTIIRYFVALFAHCRA